MTTKPIPRQHPPGPPTDATPARAGGRCGSPWKLLVTAVASVIIALLLQPAPSAAQQDLRAYCSGPGKDYKECMRKGQTSRALTPGLRGHCSRRGQDFDDCVEKYVGRSSIQDMSVYCSGPGKDYEECMDELLAQRRRRW